MGAGFNNNPLALGYFFKVPPYYTIIGFNLVIHNGGEDVSQSAQDCSMSTEEQEDEQSGQEYDELEEVTEQPGYRVSITMQLSISDYTVLLCTCIGGF